MISLLHQKRTTSCKKITHRTRLLLAEPVPSLHGRGAELADVPRARAGLDGARLLPRLLVLRLLKEREELAPSPSPTPAEALLRAMTVFALVVVPRLHLSLF